MEAEWSLFPVIKKWGTKKGFCAREPHRVLLGFIFLWMSHSLLKQPHKVTFLHLSLPLLSKCYHCSFNLQDRNLGDIIFWLLHPFHLYPPSIYFQGCEEAVLSAHLHCNPHSAASVISVLCDNLLLSCFLHFFSHPSHCPLACQGDLRK